MNLRKIAIGIICSILPLLTIAQTGWHQSPLQLPTRWSREVTPKNALPDYPRPQLERSEWQNLNGLWNYAITDSGVSQPNDFEGKILVPYPVESALSGVKKALQPNEQLWYQRSLELNKKETNKHYLLHFGALDYQTTVYVNGKEVGNHTGGYQQFSFDITDALQKGNNTLTVQVWDPTDKGNNPHGKQVLNPAGIMYTSTSGIWQTVWMETVPQAYITSLKMTPDVDGGYLSLTVNINDNGEGYTVEATAKGAGSVKGAPGQPLEIKIPGAHLWSPDDPYLYDLSVKLVKGNKITDEVKSYFGMRKIAIQKDAQGVDRIFLNNQFTYNLGVLDQGFWPDGIYTAPTDAALKWDIEAIKTIGFNTIRKHIKVEPARWYYWCDKLGMLVWQDMPYPANATEGGKQEFETESKANIEQLYDHPSIICWVLFNEGWNSYDQQRLTDWMKQADPSRLIDGHTGANYCGTCGTEDAQRWVDADLTDIHDYPGPSIGPSLPGKARVIGEFGGIGVPVAAHDWDELKGWGYIQETPATMKNKYKAMIEKLKQLETEGLSGSIYTQPFDVETEQNGLLTYDRSVIKIPVKQLQEINSTLVTPLKNNRFDLTCLNAQQVNVDDTTKLLASYIKQFKEGKRDSAFLRRLILTALRKKDQPIATKAGNAYIGHLKEPFSKENLTFITAITHTSGDSGFTLFFSQPEKVNKELGNYAAQNKVMSIITAEEVTPYLASKNKVPDWATIEKKVIGKYGELGRERIYMEEMVYYWITAPDWAMMSKYYVLYFKMALTHSIIEINNASWDIFQHVNDPEVLNYAVKVMQYDLATYEQNNVESYDTYANLLYKTGKTTEAIKWEEKAVDARKGQPDQKVYVETLEKMKKGEPTWAKE